MTEHLDCLRVALERLAALADAEHAGPARELLARWRAGVLRVLLVGEAKRGKSTLGNALLGLDVLPSGVTPVTSVATTVRADGGPARVEVRLRDGSAQTASLTDLAAFVTEEGNPSNTRGVADVTVHVGNHWPVPGVEFVDTPGAGSVYEHNTAEADAALRTMDAAVFVLTADPPVSASERALLRRVRELSVTTFVVLNKVDRLDPQELTQAEKFTRKVVADAAGTGVPVFCCSARAGLRARLAGDTAGWADSGMGRFSDALVTHLREHRLEDLRASIASAGVRTAAQMLDQAAVTLAAQDALAADRGSRVTAFAARVEDLDRARAEALAVLRDHLRRVRADLDKDAAIRVHAAIAATRAHLEAFLAGAGTSSPADLEDGGREVIATTVRGEVDAWRCHWTERLTGVVAQATSRQQQLLTAAVDAVRHSARELLAVELRTPPATVNLPESSTFNYDFAPEMGWGTPVSTALRRHSPASVGRRRVAARLRAEVGGFADKHVGRARSDFQFRLQEAARQLGSATDGAFTQQASLLRTALSDARTRSAQLDSTTQAERAALMSRREELATLVRQLEELATSGAGS